MAKVFDVNAGRSELKKDFFGTSVTPVVEEKPKKKASSTEDRVSIYLDRNRRNLIKGYVLWKRANGFPMYRIRDFYSEMVDRMIAENPQIEPYEGDLI